MCSEIGIAGLKVDGFIKYYTELKQFSKLPVYIYIYIYIYIYTLRVFITVMQKRKDDVTIDTAKI